eukprot:403350055
MYSQQYPYHRPSVDSYVPQYSTLASQMEYSQRKNLNYGQADIQSNRNQIDRNFQDKKQLGDYLYQFSNESVDKNKSGGAYQYQYSRNQSNNKQYQNVFNDSKDQASNLKQKDVAKINGQEIIQSSPGLSSNKYSQIEGRNNLSASSNKRFEDEIDQLRQELTKKNKIISEQDQIINHYRNELAKIRNENQDLKQKLKKNETQQDYEPPQQRQKSNPRIQPNINRGNYQPQFQDKEELKSYEIQENSVINRRENQRSKSRSNVPEQRNKSRSQNSQNQGHQNDKKEIEELKDLQYALDLQDQELEVGFLETMPTDYQSRQPLTYAHRNQSNTINHIQYAHQNHHHPVTIVQAHSRAQNQMHPQYNRPQSNNPGHRVQDSIGEEEILRIAIEESKETTPNTENMTYEQLLELGDKLGKVSKGLTKQQFDKIPIKIWKNVKSTDSKTCSICFDEFTKDQKVKVLNGCKHEYHEGCLGKWLEGEKRCPVCNKEVQVK